MVLLVAVQSAIIIVVILLHYNTHNTNVSTRDGSHIHVSNNRSTHGKSERKRQVESLIFSICRLGLRIHCPVRNWGWKVFPKPYI